MRHSAYTVDFTVEGRGDFPLDMLRYDSCFPQDTRDADAIAMTEAAFAQIPNMKPVMRRIHLRQISQHGIGPTDGRWASFGWKVVEHAR